MKNILYFFLFLRYLNFCPDHFRDEGERLGKKAKAKFLTGKQTNITDILLKFSRCKCNQTRKFGQPIEHNITRIFFKKIIHKVW